MDKPELNTLLDGVRWSSEEIGDAMINAVDLYNYSPPVMRTDLQTVESFPYRYILLLLVSSHLLKSAAIQQANNQLAYSADGLSVDDNNKSQIFLGLAQQFSAEAKEAIQQIKVSKNVMLAYGRRGSEFQYLVR